jgi:catechol 2,3-dioxygenase-like lactoylglutathione lyase family enzyme
MHSTPPIVDPVSRSIPVADPARTIAFYRDILDFEIHHHADPIEAVHGPARIQFTTQDAPTPAILFFETNDVAAMHAAIRARGGAPSELVKVNWIKMQMFEVRDPDGHVLWFGQSYDKPDATAPSPMLLKALPELPCDDVAAAVTYYRNVLGFHINYQQDDLGVMDRDRVTVVLIARTQKHTGIGSAYIYIENADALYAELLAKGANLQGEPVSHPWGLRDFHALDLEGNRLTFGQPFE